MPRLRIKFGVSDFLREWVKNSNQRPGIVEESVNHMTIEHAVWGAELSTFKNNFMNRVAEDV